MITLCQYATMNMKYILRFTLICNFMFNVLAGDCDHLPLYPVYTASQHGSINLTAWDKPWIPELDWLNSYINLSYYHQIYLDGLAVGYKTTKYAKYYSDATWRCLLMFQNDPDLADAYYMKHHADTNSSMVLCTPQIPMRPDLFKKWAEKSTIYSMILCVYYKLDYFRKLYAPGDLKYIWNTSGGVELRAALATAALITIIGVLGNTLILRSISVNKELQTPTNLFLASLAVADLLVTVFLPIYALHRQYFKFTVRLTLRGCIVLKILRVTLYVSSVYHLTAISFERFFAICYPMRVKSICTTRRAKIVIPILWIVSLCYGLQHIFTITESETVAGYYCHMPSSFITSHWYAVQTAANFAVMFMIPFIIFVHNYARIGRTLFQSLKENVNLQEGINTQNKINEDSEKRVKVVKMLVAVMVIFMVCWTPILLFDFWEATTKIFSGQPKSSFWIHSTRMWLQFLSHTNSCVNAFIYYLTSDQFRRAFQEQMRCSRRNTFNNPNVSYASKTGNRKRKYDRSSVSFISTSV